MGNLIEGKSGSVYMRNTLTGVFFSVLLLTGDGCQRPKPMSRCLLEFAQDQRDGLVSQSNNVLMGRMHVTAGHIETTRNHPRRQNEPLRPRGRVAAPEQRRSEMFTDYQAVVVEEAPAVSGLHF